MGEEITKIELERERAEYKLEKEALRRELLSTEFLCEPGSFDGRQMAMLSQIVREYESQSKQHGDAAIREPEPTKGTHYVIDYVRQDIEDRVAMGKERYGTKLMANNGRSALWDAYQEALDLVMYLRREIIERDLKAMGNEWH